MSAQMSLPSADHWSAAFLGSRLLDPAGDLQCSTSSGVTSSHETLAMPAQMPLLSADPWATPLETMGSIDFPGPDDSPLALADQWTWDQPSMTWPVTSPHAHQGYDKAPGWQELGTSTTDIYSTPDNLVAAGLSMLVFPLTNDLPAYSNDGQQNDISTSTNHNASIAGVLNVQDLCAAQGLEGTSTPYIDYPSSYTLSSPAPLLNSRRMLPNSPEDDGLITCLASSWYP